MKKSLNITLLLLVSMLLFSCFGGNDEEIIDAKKQLGVIETENADSSSGKDISETNIKNDEDQNNKDTINNSTADIEKQEVFEINYLTDNKFLELDEFEENDLKDGEIELTGKTLKNVDKIIVSFSNASSDYPNDEYTLQKFKSGDKTFLYRAFSRFQTLDFGKNKYIFTAYSGDEVSKLELIINLEKKDKSENIELNALEKKNNLLDTFNINDLPAGGDFGHAIEIGNGKITYSDLKGLEIGKLDEDFADCSINQETGDYCVSELLDKILDGYYWWNTCKPIKNELGTTYFVLRLDGLGYKYEKHYFLNNGIYGVYELESGENLVLKTDESKEIIAKLKEKSTNLKEKNEEYSVLEIVDNLFLKLLNNN